MIIEDNAFEKKEKNLDIFLDIFIPHWKKRGFTRTSLHSPAIFLSFSS